MWTFVICLAFCTASGATCCAIAIKRKRRHVLWTAIGYALPIVGVVLIVLLPSRASPPSRRIPRDVRRDIERTLHGSRSHFHAKTFEAIDRLLLLRERGQLSEYEFGMRRAELLARLEYIEARGDHT
ncbi:MAG: hypothetical protein QM831_43930 [Kofleriaceae bacterium]